MSNALNITCQPDNIGWRCSVVVGDDPAATRHVVSLSSDDLLRYARPRISVERPVAASFVFLLEREPRESILRAFDISVIARYFPEYERELRGRLSG